MTIPTRTRFSAQLLQTCLKVKTQVSVKRKLARYPFRSIEAHIDQIDRLLNKTLAASPYKKVKW